jgi:PIN domain nuclease of toxin-antitoxin system
MGGLRRKMKALLLDTHILLWLVFKDNNLKEAELKIIEQYAKKKALFISSISIWEIALLEKRGRIRLYEPALQWFEQILSLSKINLAPLTPDILCESVNLPEAFHKDPADRMIVATARMMQMSLLTHDKKILEYAEQGLIQSISV